MTVTYIHEVKNISSPAQVGLVCSCFQISSIPGVLKPLEAPKLNFNGRPLARKQTSFVLCFHDAKSYPMMQQQPREASEKKIIPMIHPKANLSGFLSCAFDLRAGETFIFFNFFNIMRLLNFLF